MKHLINHRRSSRGQITKIIVDNQIFSLDAEFKRQKRGILYFDSGEESAEKTSGFFSVAFGPYRRFEGGNEEWGKTFENPSFANLAAHLSVFGEDVAFTQTKSWLIGLFNTSNDPTLLDKERKDKLNQLEFIKKLVNSEELLPNNTKLESVNSKDVFFKDGNGTTISVNQMSDGYRSILSMTFELIRQLVRVLRFGVGFQKH